MTKDEQYARWMEMFLEFWQAYPRRQAKPVALKAFLKIRPDEALFQKMLKAIRKQAKTEQWLNGGGCYIPMPSTWLNQERWEDEIQLSAYEMQQLAEDEAYEKKIQDMEDKGMI
jgi:hypothetical protein